MTIGCHRDSGSRNVSSMHLIDHAVHLNAVDTKGNETLLDVRFIDMTSDLVNLWDTSVQPVIDRCYAKLPKKLAKVRLDELEAQASGGVNAAAGDAKAMKPTDKDKVSAQRAEAVQPVENNSTVSDHCDVQSEKPVASEETPKRTTYYRADVHWKWPRLFNFHRVNNMLADNLAIVSHSKAICMVSYKNGRPVPIGMLIVVPRYECTLFSKKKRRAFTWYLADAPKQFYAPILEIKKADDVAHALLDYCVQSGIAANQEPSLVLHADASGGMRLKDFYLGCGMTQLPDDHPAISPGRRMFPRDGYFKLKPDDVAEFSRVFDVYRLSKSKVPSPELA